MKDLHLLDVSRLLIRDGNMRLKSGTEIIDLNVFLLDNTLLLTKKKTIKGSIKFKVYKKVCYLFNV